MSRIEGITPLSRGRLARQVRRDRARDDRAQLKARRRATHFVAQRVTPCRSFPQAQTVLL
jgi:hypothetical protein